MRRLTVLMVALVLAVLTPSGTATADPARAAGLIDVTSIIPDAVVDLRYATARNIVDAPLYPADARCLVHESLAAGLTTAAAVLRRDGEVLVFWDCYRPRHIQGQLFEAVPDPAWVARPGQYARSHEAGRSVDVTLAAVRPECPTARQVDGYCLAEMGTDFDEFSVRAHADAVDGVSQRAQQNRVRLRTAMTTGGLTGYPGEWWHFDGPGADVPRPFLDVELGGSG
ncbi:M15 family metallopeptidase [Mycolicibacterium thermoresistibile]